VVRGNLGDPAARPALLLRMPPQLRRPLGRARAALRRRDAQPLDPDVQWFWDHYRTAAGEIAEFLGEAGVPLEGRVVADVGCGDGIMAFGVAHQSRPAVLRAFDVNDVDVDVLLERARRYGVADELPEQLTFMRSEATSLPAEDAAFDVVYTWSVFEHVADPPGLLRDIHRVLKPDGALFLQLWPFYYSARGSHLWEWFPEPFHHLLESDEEIAAAMRASDRHTHEWTEYMLKEFLALNRVTLNDLQRGIVDAGLVIRKVQLIAETWPVPEGVASYPLSDLGVSGVKLIAVPATST
jgi:ubiquinone/menaquinone biosynthesis C-methylase UbiE